MRALLQRVRSASVSVAGKEISRIKAGYLILLGVREGDTPGDAEVLAAKTAELRIFEDENGKMNRSLLDVGGQALVVSQFTLCADCRKGRRPSFINAMRPPMAEELYLSYAALLRQKGVGYVGEGEFGADMLVSIENDGPVTILLDTEELKKKG